MKTIITQLEKNADQLYNVHIFVSAEDANEFITNDRRVRCLINNSKTIQCALIPDGKGDFFIIVNQKLRKELGLNIGDQVTLKLEKDNSKYGIATSDEFIEVLQQDDEGAEYFHKLTPGKQRSLIHLVCKPKSSQLKIDKTIKMLEYLKSTGGKLDFKELSEVMKTR